MGTDTTIKTKQGPMEVLSFGRGPALLVAHGRGWGSTARNYAWMAEELPDFRLITVARPGYGQTPLSTGETFEQQGSALIALLDALEIDKAFAMGVSNGGPPAVVAAAQFPERLNGLVLWCAVAASLVSELPSDYLADQLDRDKIAAEYELEIAMTKQALEDAEFAKQVASFVLTPSELQILENDQDLRRMMRARSQLMLEAPPGFEGLRNDRYQTQASHSTTPSSLDVPMLIMHGDEDITVPMAHARLHAKLNPSAKLHLIPGASHAVFLTHRKEVMASLTNFLESAARN